MSCRSVQKLLATGKRPRRSEIDFRNLVGLRPSVLGAAQNGRLLDQVMELSPLGVGEPSLIAAVRDMLFSELTQSLHAHFACTSTEQS